jgi:hypothetical protein
VAHRRRTGIKDSSRRDRSASGRRQHRRIRGCAAVCSDPRRSSGPPGPKERGAPVADLSAAVVLVALDLILLVVAARLEKL